METKLKFLKSPYFQLATILSGFIAFFILLFFGNGLVWQANQAKLEKQKFAFEREKEVTNLRNNIDNTLNAIIDLNNEIYKKEMEDTLSEQELNIFKSRYDFLVDNLKHYQSNLEILTKTPHEFQIPNPLKKYFDYDHIPLSPPTNLRIVSLNKNFLLYTIKTNVITFIGFVLFLIFMTFFITKFYLQRKGKKSVK